MKRLLAIVWLSVVAAQAEKELTVRIDCRTRFQMIENIGASSGMHGAHVAGLYPQDKLDRIAELLFSMETGADGRPKGIGLTSFRVMIGAGSAGPESGIRQPYHRADCFLRPDGLYDWSRCPGSVYWMKKAREYKLPCLIGFVNSPPVCWTKNGLGYKTDKDHSSNLKPEHYGDYAAFLAQVAEHFRHAGLGFDYISPINEPQWEWAFEHGAAKQEGSPWKNTETAAIVREIDRVFRQKQIKARLLIPEAADLGAVAAPQPGRPHREAADQISAFWNSRSPDYIGDLCSVARIVAAHSYFADGDPARGIAIRRRLAEKVAETGGGLRFWQTEYSLLEEGYRFGLEGEENEMHNALVLGKVLHLDFTVAQAAAWQFWSSTGGKHNGSTVPRFHLIRLDSSADYADGELTPTKLLWTLGHFSRFVRPGMVRVGVERSDGISAEQATEELMISAYADHEKGMLVTVLVNRSAEPFAIRPELGMAGRPMRLIGGVVTDERRDMARLTVEQSRISVPGRSIVTLVSKY